jgi:hypothetical protein
MMQISPGLAVQIQIACRMLLRDHWSLRGDMLASVSQPALILRANVR